MAKVILITGASSGIGREAAGLLASQGHKVYGAARRVETRLRFAQSYLISRLYFSDINLPVCV